MAAFTTIAAGVGLAATAGSTAMSFGQAGAQRRKMEQAQREAAQKMAEARKKLEVNVYEELAIPKEAYELEREALLTQGATALQAGVEGEARGAAATAGRVQMAQQQGQAKVRAQMGQELAQLEKLKAAEESRLRDIGVQLDLGEVAGAQQAAADAEAARARAMEQGMQGITATAQQAAQFVPLYQKSGQARAFNKAAAANPNLQQDIAKVDTFQGVDVSGVGDMSSIEFQDFMTSNFTKQQLMPLTRDLTAMPLVQPIGGQLQPIGIDPFNLNIQPTANISLTGMPYGN